MELTQEKDPETLSPLSDSDAFNKVQVTNVLPPGRKCTHESDSIPFSEGKYLIIDVPVDARGTAYVYIDDKISLTVDVKDSNKVQRIEQETLLAAHFSA